MTAWRSFGYFYALFPRALPRPSPMAKAPTRSTPAPESFEDALKELEAIVDAMENGDGALEASLAAYQRGVELLKFCQDKLGAAEQKVRMLENGELRDFASQAGEAD